LVHKKYNKSPKNIYTLSEITAASTIQLQQ